MEDDFVGAIKIKDGLFIGDEYAAQDFEFVVTNKVTHIINCAGKQIPNYWETVGVAYLTYDWMDSENQIVFDTKGEVVNQIYNFIEEAVRLGEGVLVHSVKGQSRSCCVLTAYFMKRYRWSLYKTLEFLTSRRSDLEIRTSFYHQLLNLESKIFQQQEGNVTVNWFELGSESDHEEMLLRNTFLNARSAPFDEVLVNPQNFTDNRPRKLNWGDERAHNKVLLASFFDKETLAARLAKPVLKSVKSILKGSDKVFKLKSKSNDEDSTSSSKGTSSPSPGLRMHKSVKNFSEVRNAPDAILDDANMTPSAEDEERVIEKYQESKGSKATNMQRSSSASYFEREENPRPSSSKGSLANNEKLASAKASNINGNIIHLTVNNYHAPVNNLNNLAQPSNFNGDKESNIKSNSNSQTQQSNGTTSKYNLPIDLKKNDTALGSKKESYSDKQNVNMNGSQASDKSTLSTNHLKSAIEKKLSKEYKAQMSASVVKTDIQTLSGKPPVGDKNTNETKSAKIIKEYSKPTDIKVNYQVLLKNRETPPPRKREDAKKIPESPQKKAVSKSSFSSSKTGGDSGLPYSSYLNSLFSTSFSHLNTVTPSAYATNPANIEKKTPGSTKATPITYSLTLSQKAQTLTRPQRTNTNQTTDKNYSSSMLGSSLTKSKLLYTNDPPSTTNLNAKYNNYMTQAKGNPVRITYEKIDRPQSATPDRSVTPQAGLRRVGTPSTVGFTTKSANNTEQRLSAPAKNAKHAKKDSGSTQDLLAKYRQRSSSPSQMGYNSVLSNSMSVKSKSKY